MERPTVWALVQTCGSKVNVLVSMRVLYVLWCIIEDRKQASEQDGHATNMQKHYDSLAKSCITPGIRPPKMPSGQGIRTQKWSNPLLCPVGGRWGMTVIGALILANLDL